MRNGEALAARWCVSVHGLLLEIKRLGNDTGLARREFDSVRWCRARRSGIG